MATLFGMFPFLKTLFGDSGFQGPKFAKALAKVLPHLTLESSNVPIRSADLWSCPNAGSSSVPLHGSIAAEGLPRENLNRKALAFLPRINPPHAQKTLQSGLSLRTDSESSAEREGLGSSVDCLMEIEDDYPPDEHTLLREALAEIRAMRSELLWGSCCGYPLLPAARDLE
jgi:hypothetical protein